MKTLLNEIDDLLAHIEDYTHGAVGEEITKMRHKIADFKPSVSLPSEEEKFMIAQKWCSSAGEKGRGSAFVAGYNEALSLISGWLRDKKINK